MPSITAPNAPKRRGPPLPSQSFLSRVTLSDVEAASLLLGASSTKFSSKLLVSLAALRRQSTEGDCLVCPPARLTATQISRDLRSSWEALRGIDPSLCRARYVSLANAALADPTLIDVDLAMEIWEPFSSGSTSSSSSSILDDTSNSSDGGVVASGNVDLSTSVSESNTTIEKEDDCLMNTAFSGWLLKKRENVIMLGNPWRARFCVIVGRQLRSYEGSESSPEDVRDVFFLSQDIAIQGETVIGSKSSSSNTSSTSTFGGGNGQLTTDAAGKTSIHKSVFPEGFDMTVITSSKPPDGASERGMLAPISISQSGQTYLFATHGNGAIEDRERWLAALRASQFGALGGDEEGENGGAGLGGKGSSSSSSSAPSFSSPVRSSLKMKVAKLTTPIRPQSIRRLSQLNNEASSSSISSMSIGVNERRRSSVLSNLEVAHSEATPRKSNSNTLGNQNEGEENAAANELLQTTTIMSTPQQKPSKLASTIKAALASSKTPVASETMTSSILASKTPVASATMTSLISASSSTPSSSSSSSTLSSSSSSLFIPAPLPSSPNLSSKIAQLQDMCRQKSVSRDLKSAGWDEAGATRNNGVTVYAALDGGASSRGDAFISHPRSAILSLITSIPSRKIIDERFDTGETIESFGTGERPHTSIQHMTFFGIPPVSNRDYVTLTHWSVNEDGTIFVVSGSIEDKRCPEISGVVRAELSLAAWVVRPRSVSQETGEVDETKGSDVTYMNFTDLKGWVPMAIKRTVASQQALLVARVRDKLDGGYMKDKPAQTQVVVNVPHSSLSLSLSASASSEGFQTPIKPRRLSIEKVDSTTTTTTTMGNDGGQNNINNNVIASSSSSSSSSTSTSITQQPSVGSGTDRTALLEAEVARLQCVIDSMRTKELALRRDLATLTMRFAGVSTSAGSSGLLKPGAFFATQGAPVFSLLASASLNVTKKGEEK
jgi:hypothetical protein